MSHVVKIQTRLHDPAALAAACRRLGLADPVVGTAELFGGRAAGHVVRLPGWTYPVVVDALTAVVSFDHFEGRWGDPKKLDRLLQAYAVEKCRAEARKKGYAVTEQQLADGSVKLTIVEGAQ
jgi:hypothetical protein